MSKTKIEWCDHTINPVIGCTKCSPGCDNCYAEKMAMRLACHPGAVGGRYSRVVFHREADRKGWVGNTDVDFSCFKHLPKKSARIFIGSMGDVFHERVFFSNDYIQLFESMQKYPKHTFMLLTKRQNRMKNIIEGLGSICDLYFPVWPLPNVWLGVTVCNQQEADEKIPILLSTPAAKRFVSVEPMLGSVDLTRIEVMKSFAPELLKGENAPSLKWNALSCADGWNGAFAMQTGEELPLLDWVICGGETGPGARLMEWNWACSLRDQCSVAGVPFFFKKMGDASPCIPHENEVVREFPS